MLIGRILRGLGLAHLVLGALVAALVTAQPTVRGYGDRLQVVLPILGWGCALTRAEGKDFALRFALLWAGVRGSKALLGETPLNLRPTGETGGFPSAHTSAAAIGTSRVVQDCLRGNPGAQAVLVITAGFVGGTRIELGAHTVWQVTAGALFGWAADRALRRGPARDRARQLVQRAAGALARARRRHGLSPARLVAAFGLVCLIGLAALPALA